MASAAQAEETPAVISDHQRSLPAFMVTAPFVRSKTMQLFIDGQLSSAVSTIDFKSSTLFPLKEPSAVIIKLQAASLILSAKDLAEKPAKTTE